ncbi:MAG: response regulator transcription factor [Curvibacter sp.]
MNILVLEDQDDLRTLFVMHLGFAGHKVRGARNAIELDTLMAQEAPDLLLLDINLPGESGISVAKRLRSYPGLTIVMMTARCGPEDRVQGFEAGADSYLVKPVGLRELDAVIARIQERRQAVVQQDCEGWVLKIRERRLVSPDQIVVPLTLMEVQLLSVIVKKEDRTATRRQMIEAIGFDYMSYDERRIEVSLSRLRRKIKSHTGVDVPIKALRGMGYGFDETCRVVW